MGQSSNESVTWRDAHLYALELIDENIFTREELLDSLSQVNTNNPNKIYEWLADRAIEKHAEKMDDNDIATDVFYNNKPVLFFDDIYEDYLKTQNKRYRTAGSAIIALAAVATALHIGFDDNLSLEDVPVYIVNINLGLAGAILAFKHRK